jgi:hypothetical protein
VRCSCSRQQDAAAPDLLVAAGGGGSTATLLQQAQQLVAAGHDRAVQLLQLHGGLEQQQGPGGAAAQGARLQLQLLLDLCLGQLGAPGASAPLGLAALLGLLGARSKGVAKEAAEALAVQQGGGEAAGLVRLAGRCWGWGCSVSSCASRRAGVAGQAKGMGALGEHLGEHLPGTRSGLSRDNCSVCRMDV